MSCIVVVDVFCPVTENVLAVFLRGIKLLWKYAREGWRCCAAGGNVGGAMIRTLLLFGGCGLLSYAPFSSLSFSFSEDALRKGRYFYIGKMQSE